MEGLSLGVKQMSIGSKSVLPPIGSGRKNSYSKKTPQPAAATASSTRPTGGKPETSPRVTRGGMGIAGSGLNANNNNNSNNINSNSSSDSSDQPRSSQGKQLPPSAAKNKNNTAAKSSKGSGPTKMQRAKHWSVEAENAYRFQSAGFRDSVEYEEMHPSGAEMWEETGFVRQLQNKTTGFFMYFRQTRECEDKYLGKTKLYTY